MINITGQVPKAAKALYLSHGGGPMPLLGDAGHLEMVEALELIAATITKPELIIMVSAHWEESVATITSGVAPSVIYDYYGFPAAAYEIEYPALGSPLIAEQIHSAFSKNNIDSRMDGRRGFDHGLFVPLRIMYPEADVPCVQVSLVKGLDPSLHIQMGKALAEVSNDDVLIIGSGFSFHNMAAFSEKDTDESRRMNAEFESWLLDTCTSSSIDENKRAISLCQWEKAPSARYCHPREEHLLPLHTCYGASHSKCAAALELSIIGKKSSMYLW